MSSTATDRSPAVTSSSEEDIRIIETAFPIQQVSLDSVHEKYVSHGHISTFHIWPARRPLAASRAALLTTLLKDPGNSDMRRKLLSKIAGHKSETQNPSTGHVQETTEGGILHWGREISPYIEMFRKEILESFGGRTPRVLDPFAGGGAIPLEAMRLGCTAIASDINPLAWFILRCTLHYPRLLTQSILLPPFALNDREFMIKFFKSQGISNKAQLNHALQKLGHSQGHTQMSIANIDAYPDIGKASFDWHLRAWGEYVLRRVRQKLARYYPTYAEYEPVRRRRTKKTKYSTRTDVQRRPPQLLDPDPDGIVSAAELNARFDPEYLNSESNPRWVMKPTVAYLWARTVSCANCRAEIPLLKTCWLYNTSTKQVLLRVEANRDGTSVSYEIDTESHRSGRFATIREASVGAGTMNRSGVKCPCCDSIMTMKDLRIRGQAGMLGRRMVAVVVNGQTGKEYRLPRPEEFQLTRIERSDIEEIYRDIPFSLPDEKLAGANALGFRAPLYGFSKWVDVFTDRQLLALGMFVAEIRRVTTSMDYYPREWSEAIRAYLAPSVCRIADRGSTLATWQSSSAKIRNTFARFALPMVWDFAESCPLNNSSGGYSQAVEWIARVFEHLQQAGQGQPIATVLRSSAMALDVKNVDLICTDPPYYDAIPYSDLMDFFYIWIRRVLHGTSPEFDSEFSESLGPKWNAEENDGELIDDASRFRGDSLASKRNYEEGMYRAFSRFHNALNDDGRLVIVFANKQPDAWETLVSALVRAGFVVTASWPIQTEMRTRQRSLTSAALSSSIWLVCKKRSVTATVGWDGQVLAQMEENISRRAHDFWDAGIRGPDFIWAAIGPALEAFSMHAVVKKADEPGHFLTVTEFLRSVRRIVVAFVVNKILQREGTVDELDDLTTYYLLHRRDFGLAPAPAGACILYALSCNLSDSNLIGRLNVLVRTGRTVDSTAGRDVGDQRGSGGELRLKEWDSRLGPNLGEHGVGEQAPPIVDCVHKLMHLWRTGDQRQVDNYLGDRGLWNREIFAQVIQSLIELADQGSEERSTLESIQNHIQGRRTGSRVRQGSLL